MSQECTVDGCGRPAQEMICTGCLTELVTALRELAFGVTSNGDRRPGLLQDLQDAVTRQAKTGSDAVKRGSAELPLPFHVEASDLAWDAQNTVGTWAREFAENNPHLTPTWRDIASAAEWLAAFPALLAMHPAADEMHGEITDVGHRVRRMVDRAPDRIYLGKCGCETDGVVCTDDLFGVLHRELVRCRTCGAEHDAHARWKEVQERVREVLATAAEISGWIAQMYGRHINANTIRVWAHRRQLQTFKGAGGTLYRVGDVLDMADSRGELRSAS